MRRFELSAFDIDGAAKKCTANARCSRIECDDRVGRVAAEECDARFVLWDSDTLVIDTWANLDNEPLVTIDWRMIDCPLNGCEIARSVRRHHDVRSVPRSRRVERDGAKEQGRQSTHKETHCIGSFTALLFRSS